MDYITLAPQSELPPSLEEVDAHSMYAAFEKITDGRWKRGIRYSMALILTLILLAKLAGEPKLSGVAHWVRLRGTWLNEVLPLQRTSWPAASTYTYVLERLDAQEVTRLMQQCLTRAQTSQRHGERPSRLATQGRAEQRAHIAMDGKMMRGTLGHEAPNQASVHLLALDEVGTGTVLAQRAVQTKEDEISAAPELVTPELIKGRISSADAIHTQKKWCHQVTRAGGDYRLIAKNNQSTLHEDLALYLEDPQADRSDWVTASTCDNGHGRLEKRTLWPPPTCMSFWGVTGPRWDRCSAWNGPCSNAEQQADLEHELIRDNQQETLLQAYIDKISELLLIKSTWTS